MNKSVPQVDFDHWSREYAIDPWAANLRYGAKCPVAHSDHHNGFWMVTGYDELSQVVHDDATFSSRHDLPNGSTPLLGIQIPPIPFRVTPMELDPPESLAWRQQLNRLFAPGAIEPHLAHISAYTTWCIDQHIEKGSMDLVHDLASPVSALTNMHVLGIPSEAGLGFARLSHALVYFDPASPECAAAYMEYKEAVANLQPLVEERRINPVNDVVSHLANMEIDGVRITDEQVLEVLDLFVSAGIDTTASAIANCLNYLDTNREARQSLIDSPELIPSAVEEFLRYFSPVQVLARTATKDVELGGQQICAGDRVGISWAAANLDSRQFENPETIDLQRSPNRHVAFGLGAHRCIGLHIARAEMGIVIAQVLARLPDYTITKAEKYGVIGVVQGYGFLESTFTPGQRIGGASELDALIS